MRRKTEAQGFTLLELMLVVFIIGILAALVVGRFVGVQEGTQVKATGAQISLFKTAIERYKLDMGKYPTTEEGLVVLVTRPMDEDLAKKWHGPYLDSSTIPKDPWDRDYVYKCPGDHNTDSYDILSWGPDGNEGTEDDIKNWQEQS
jgi:general secretion pathway protein G